MEPVTLPEIIEGETIVLKKNNVSWAKHMFACVDSDRERLRKFLPWVDSTKSASDSANYIKSTEHDWENKYEFDYGLFRKSDHTYIGNFGAHTVSWANDRCELGYWIAGDYEGQGYISDAVRTFERVLFKTGFN